MKCKENFDAAAKEFFKEFFWEKAGIEVSEVVVTDVHGQAAGEVLVLITVKFLSFFYIPMIVLTGVKWALDVFVDYSESQDMLEVNYTCKKKVSF